MNAGGNGATVLPHDTTGRPDDAGVRPYGVEALAQDSADVAGGPYGLAAAAAHQLRGPLSSIRLRLQMLGERRPDVAELPGVLGEVDRLAALLNQILDWGAAGQGPPPEPVEVLDVAAARADAWSVLADARDVRIDLTGTAATALQTHGALEHALDVLLDNAVQAAPPGTTVTCAVRVAGHHVHVSVTDEGPGMTDAELAHAGHPFRRGTSGATREGSGLGLAIAASLLRASGGLLGLGRAASGGLAATAVLPLAPD
ncbi:HAMP domain-containing sensor histidine kinase [Streptomyces sp. NPDC047461]|uniref:sensor histidine kinase n=1 Tax=Streptomyces sp. NPDC047461 TaxID=3155619 RepID=UPI00340E23C5